MAVYTRATASARRHQEILFYSQAVDTSTQIPRWHRDTTIYERALGVPSLPTTSRLPGIVLFHLNMRVRLTTQVLPPWAVQDTTGTIMEIDLCDPDREQLKEKMDANDDARMDSELCLSQLPKGFCVELDKCDRDSTI